jgi:peptide/nickel transport system substrate-binding protein
LDAGSPDAAPATVYRVAGVPRSLDPTSAYDPVAFGVFDNLLVRTLVGYRHVEGSAGVELVADLATEVPEVSDDGLTYIFFLKDGIRFGPPLDREITSADLLYAMRRIDYSFVDSRGYGFYYDGTIVGMDGPQDVMPAGITGIEAPDDKTIIFHLQQPTGDFLYRMALAATAPIPEEVARCVPEVNRYARFLIATGPYMIEGSEKLDLSSCRAMQPIAGFDLLGGHLRLVRNPAYDPKTDDTMARGNRVGSFDFQAEDGETDVWAMLAAGQLEEVLDSPPPEVVAAAAPDRLHVAPADRTLYVTMNLAQPPFDDVHVRRAVSYIIDKAAIQGLLGGPVATDIAAHVLPPTMTGGHPTAAEYDPYASPGSAGDLDKAKAEMKLSAYDHDGDGLCDDPACIGVLHLVRDNGAWPDVGAVVETDLLRIGIQLETTQTDTGDFYYQLGNASLGVPIATGAGWSKDYPDPSTFMILFQSSLINQINFSLVGLTAEQAKELNVPGNTANIPSVDQDIADCDAAFIDDRVGCWIDLDKKLMTEVVPWVPLVWVNTVSVSGPAVSRYDYDQSTGTTAFAQVDVDPSKQAAMPAPHCTASGECTGPGGCCADTYIARNEQCNFCCTPPGQTCMSDEGFAAECCPTGTDVGYCQRHVCCATPGASCGGAVACCSPFDGAGYACIGGTCQAPP